MINITKINTRLFSKLGQSGSIFGIGIIEAIKELPNIVVLSSDMSSPAGLDRFKSMFPCNFFNVGIAEQNLIGIASGMASEGKIPIVTAQAAFASMRSYEQVRQYLGYMNSSVIVVGISSGFALTLFGNTHYAIEDISLMRSIPNITIVSPSDAGQAVKAFIESIKLNKPVYFRITGGLNTPIIYNEDFKLEIGTAIKLRDGNDIAIFATGSMVIQALKAAEILNNKSISVTLYDMHTIKPLDYSAIIQSSKHKLIVSVEEHNIIGGLGTAISEFLSSKGNMPKLIRLGVKDCFSKPGDYNYLLTQHRLIAEYIAEDILYEYNTL